MDIIIVNALVSGLVASLVGSCFSAVSLFLGAWIMYRAWTNVAQTAMKQHRNGLFMVRRQDNGPEA